MPNFDQTEFSETGPTSVFSAPGAVTPTSFGELRFRLLKAVPGSDPDLMDGWIQDRYQYILDRLSWNRIERSTAMQTFAPYQVGSVTLAQGTTAVSLQQTPALIPVPIVPPVLPDPPAVWVPGMTGCQIRFEGRNEYYEFTPTDGTDAVIDRPYEGPGGVGLAYILFASVYQLPADCREVRGVRLLECPRSLERKSKQEVNFSTANRALTGKPLIYAPYMDYESAPPIMQVEVYPAPDAVMSMVVDYTAEQLLPGQSSTALLPWMRPSALYEGARASALEQEKDYGGADRAEAKFLALLEQMVAIENRNTPAQQMRAAPRFVRHRIERALWSQPRRPGRVS